jgi:RsmE family RNA methyltransferase
VNLLLLRDDDFQPDGTVRLQGRRARHAHEVLRAQHGQALRVGKWRGLTGTGEVLSSDREALVLRVALTDPPPARPGCDLVLAIPRPKALKRVIAAASSLGVDRLVLVNAARVEKSYFDSKVLAPDFIEQHVLLGLEQARDTVPPEVLVRDRFRPFVEDELPSMFARERKLLPHPAAEGAPPSPAPGERVVFAVGPEGGWVPFEVDLLRAQGFTACSLGPRVLRVETCVPFLLGYLAAAAGTGLRSAAAR